MRHGGYIIGRFKEEKSRYIVLEGQPKIYKTQMRSMELNVNEYLNRRKKYEDNKAITA